MRFFLFFLSALLVPVAAYGYPNGTPLYVTDTGPFCASCHSAVKAEYMPELQPEVAQKEIVENKHFGLVRSMVPPSPYIELTEDRKEGLIEVAKLIDSNSSVTIISPSKAKKGGEIKVEVRAKGGNGPVIGVMLVDRAVRFQARPPSADGWAIAGEPQVRGQDGALQNTWLEKRWGGKRNLNFIIVFDQKFDMEKKVFPEADIIYTLKAPPTAGTYTLSAAFLYGTENATSSAFFQRPSGRILFSEEIKITVE